MGYLKERYGITMLPVIPHEGQCIECGAEHTPDMPHDAQSLRYQYTYYDSHGHFPSWRDAMAHCSPYVQKAWIGELRKQGIDTDARPEELNGRFSITRVGDCNE